MLLKTLEVTKAFFLTRSFSSPEEILKEQLQSRRLVKARISDQKAWARTFTPSQIFDTRLTSWELLQRFTMPLTSKFASRSHLQGLTSLNLASETQMDFESFSELVKRTTGWTLMPCHGEISARYYFSMLSRKEFPCVKVLRPVRGVLCNDRPDFWHEAVGHIAALVDPEVSAFYVRCGTLFNETFKKGNLENIRNLEKILWVAFEYGFRRESNQWKAFGAALAGSFVALTKWQQGQWCIQEFKPKEVLESGLFDGDRKPKRNAQDQIIFYGFQNLDVLYEDIVCFISL